MTTLFRNAQVLTPHGFERGLDVLVEGGRIVAVAHDLQAANATTIDLDDGFLVPGFIDTQVNGGGDVLLNDTPTVAGVQFQHMMSLSLGGVGEITHVLNSRGGAANSLYLGFNLSRKFF